MNHITRITAAPALTAAAGLLLAACGSSTTPTSAASGGDGPTVAKAGRGRVESTPAGPVLGDPQGRALYAFAADPRGRSNCSGSCLTYGPRAAGSDSGKGLAG